MPKDYTDYLICVLDAGDRVYHLDHIRNTRERGEKSDRRELIFQFRSYKYLLDMDRAYRYRGVAWPRVVRGPDRVFTMNTGFVLCDNGNEGQYRKVKDKPLKLSRRVRVIASLKEVFRSKKIGFIWYQEPCTNRCRTCPMKDKGECPTGVVEPIHVSRMHQPSGRILDGVNKNA